MALPQNTPQVVPPAWQPCRLAGIASFKPGVWNGKPHSPAFVKQLSDNFQKFSSGKNPYYTPYVSLNHKDELRCGYVDGASVDSSGILRLDADGIPESVAQWRNAGGLVQPSIEYFEPVRDPAGNLVDGFRLPDGSISPTPVLKCLTLLGADAPAVKGLPDLPAATYSQRARQFSQSCVRRFANAEPSSKGVGMDRNSMIAALQAMGIDTTSITDVVPDEVLKSWLESLQKLQANPAAPAAATPDATQQMADLGGGLGGAAALPAAAPAGIPGIGNQQPSSVVLKFSDQSALQRWMNEKEAAIVEMERRFRSTQLLSASLNGAMQQQAKAAKFADVTAFVELLARPDQNKQVRIQPAQRAFFVASLMKFDNTSVRKFSDNSNQTGTELEEAKKQLLSSLPKIKLGDKVPDPAPGTGGTTGAGIAGIDPARRDRMLAATPQGRKILADQAAKTVAAK